MRGRLRLAVATAILGALVPATIAVATSTTSTSTSTRAVGTSASATWPDPAGVLHGAPIHGMILSDARRHPAPAIPDLPRLKAIGVNTVSLYIYVHMASPTANDVRITTSTVSDTELAQVTNAAHNMGMAVQFVPVVLVDSPSHYWRGRIAPASISAWFRSYNLMITHYTYLAQDLKVELLCIGSELDSIQYRSYNWSQMSAWIHRHYSGLRTFMPSGTHVYAVTWWSAVDLISVSPYYSLSNFYVDPTPTVGELVYVWKHAWLPRLAALSAKFHRPVVFAEIGYCSVTGATSHPSYAYNMPGTYSQQAQADAYMALYRAVYGARWLRGIIWWHWDTAHSPLDRGFAMRDKQAECVIAHNWARQSTSVGPPVDTTADVCLVNHTNGLTS